MNRNGLILAVALGMFVLPGAAQAQNTCKTGNNVQTRSAGLYLQRARTNPRPEDKQSLTQQALEAALESTQQDPGNARGWFLAGQAYARLGDLTRADEMWDRVEQLCTEYEDLKTERSNAYIQALNAGITASQQGRVDEAIEHMKRADIINQARPEARISLGNYYLAKGQHAEGIDAFRSALEILRGPARADLDAKQQAQWAEYEEAAVLNLAQLLAISNRNEEAITAYRDYLEIEPGSMLALQNLAVLLAREGRREESAQLFADMLARDDLDDRQYFNVGVGLLTAEQREQAADAFRKSIELNPHSRDAYYFLAQAAYQQSLGLEEEISRGGSGKAAAETKLRSLYETMVEASERAQQYDPYNPNIFLIMARANRGLADLAANEAAAGPIRRRVAQALERQAALPFKVLDVTQTIRSDEVVLRGTIENVKTAVGTPVRLRVTLLDQDGNSLAEEIVDISAPAPGESTPFEVTIAAEREDVAGWRYEVVS